MDEQYQQAGLLVYAADDNYLKFDYIVDNQAGQPVARRIEFRSGGGVVGDALHTHGGACPDARTALTLRPRRPDRTRSSTGRTRRYRAR
jgi:hypothetical protein